MGLLSGPPLKSVCRYQYLELAYYIAHGKCPDPDNPGEHGYILNLYTYPAMHLYLQESPKAVSKDTEEVYAKEFVFGSRVSMGVGYVKEDRTFMYMDAKVGLSFHASIRSWVFMPLSCARLLLCGEPNFHLLAPQVLLKYLQNARNSDDVLLEIRRTWIKFELLGSKVIKLQHECERTEDANPLLHWCRVEVSRWYTCSTSMRYIHGFNSG